VPLDVELGGRYVEGLRRGLAAGANMPRYQTKAPVFDHGVSPRELADQPAAPWYNHRNEPTSSDDFSFISAARIRDFLSDNLDENADHFVYVRHFESLLFVICLSTGR